MSAAPITANATINSGWAKLMWVNSADDPDNCSFTLLSVVRRSDLVLAIGTGGRSPALASYLRRTLGEEIGPEYATLLDLLSDLRERTDVMEVEAFPCLKLYKQTFAWGT